MKTTQFSGRATGWPTGWLVGKTDKCFREVQWQATGVYSVCLCSFSVNRIGHAWELLYNFLEEWGPGSLPSQTLWLTSWRLDRFSCGHRRLKWFAEKLLCCFGWQSVVLIPAFHSADCLRGSLKLILSWAEKKVGLFTFEGLSLSIVLISSWVHLANNSSNLGILSLLRMVVLNTSHSLVRLPSAIIVSSMSPKTYLIDRRSFLILVILMK